MSGALDKFLAMGGYAIWVWPGYALATLALVGLLAVSLASLRRRERAFSAVRKDRRSHDA